MMVSDGLPTRLLLQPARASMADLQRRLSQAQTEASTGRHEDVNGVLGARLGTDMALRLQLSLTESSVEIGKQAGIRAESSQNALTTLSSIADQFRSSLSGARNAPEGRAIASQSAQSAIAATHGTLAMTYDGQYLFGGLATDSPPLKPYENGPRQDVIAAFHSEFGFSPDDPQAAGLSSAQVNAFFDGTFKTLFEPPKWATDWSNADDSTLKLTLPDEGPLDLSTTANAAFARTLMKSFVIVDVFAKSALNTGAFQTAADKSLALVSEGQISLANEQARIGAAQSRLKLAQDTMSRKTASINSALSAFEAVDPYEAATRVNLLMNQLESSYALTGRISKLTLLSYI